MPVSTMLMSLITALQDNADAVFQAKHQLCTFYCTEGLPGLAAIQRKSQAQQCHCAAAAKARFHTGMLLTLPNCAATACRCTRNM